MKRGEITRKDLRNFGLLVGGAFAVLATLQLLLHGILNPYVLYGIAAVLLLLGLVAPQVLRPVHLVWMKLGQALGYVMNRVILGLIFFVIFTLVAAFMRLFRRDTLKIRGSEKRDSYWQIREEPPSPPERYERQF
jgi:MFS family permease